MCFETMNEAAARACKERDELKRELEETKELLEAAKSAQGLLQIHLVKVQEERDALKKIISGGIDACNYCEHEMEGLCGRLCECVECTEKCVCGTCDGGSAFELRKREDET